MIKNKSYILVVRDLCKNFIFLFLGYLSLGILGFNMDI